MHGVLCGEGLCLRFIRHSTCYWWEIFEEKTDSSLWPCIDYCYFNASNIIAYIPYNWYHWTDEEIYYTYIFFKHVLHRGTRGGSVVDPAISPLAQFSSTSLRFIIDVNASDSAVGAILSQHHGLHAKLFSFDLISRKLPQAERNYDVGITHFGHEGRFRGDNRNRNISRKLRDLIQARSGGSYSFSNSILLSHIVLDPKMQKQMCCPSFLKFLLSL